MSTAPSDPVAPVLTEAVRRRVLELAAAALADLPEPQVPSSLMHVRRFAPGRRATAGALPLAHALERDDAFRAQVASAVRESQPELSSALESGDVPATAEPVEVAALVYVLRGERWAERLDVALDRVREQAERSDAQVVRRDLERMQDALERARAQLRQVRQDSETAQQELVDELAATRRELRRHRSDADRTRAQARALAEQAQAEVERAQGAARAAQERARKAEAELTRTREALEALRRADREGRSLAGSRARLLLDTVVDAASGLRRELGLAPADVLPADLVGEASAAGSALNAPARARDDDDPAVLAELLSLPRAHLIVDGYNVTKGAYGELPLADQRSRLVFGLSHLQARTRAEVTCCFDGAVVEGRVQPPGARGVRVRFSEPGEIADELIRRLVRAEPQGRVVIVVSSDREVADGVRAAGARPVPSVALARLLDRA